eukprot:Phypoly_transcript_20220.p1 GENE.Phypoly_transcript_20220~~Phypoly_transcript_20220.p1  ORF type:complete len:162 (+),score=18.53 Phypoly_transcript_20220:68-553(+)
MRAQKNLNPWQRFKGNISKTLLSAIEARVHKEMHGQVTEMGKQKLAEGLISQLFMVWWLSCIYFLFEHLFLTILFVGSFTGGVYYLIQKYHLLDEFPQEYAGIKIDKEKLGKNVKRGIDHISSGLADEAKLLGMATTEITSSESRQKSKEDLPSLFEQKTK